jgi:hypothetical protein
MIMDMMMGFFILGVLMTLMAVGLRSHHEAAIRLANARAACNAAEEALTDLQQGRPASQQVQVDRLPGGTVVPDFTWVRVTATIEGRSASLTGLAKTTALKGG